MRRPSKSRANVTGRFLKNSSILWALTIWPDRDPFGCACAGRHLATPKGMKQLGLFALMTCLTACSGSGYSSFTLTKSSAVTSPADSAPPSAANDFICASLGGKDGVFCPSPDVGLKGKIYVLPSGYSGPNNSISDVITNGVPLSLQIQMTDFDVPTRSFTEGFPLSDGSLLKGPDGQPVTAWFAFDLRGYLTLRAPYAPGLYEFAFYVDDGAILTVDGQQIVNFDGYHPSQWSCSPTPLALDVDQKHAMSLQYFQGPPTELALRMLIRPYDANRPCDETGGFVPLPGNFLSN